MRLRLASRAPSRSGDGIWREQAAERRQAEPLLAARERGEGDRAALPSGRGAGPRRRAARRGRARRRPNSPRRRACAAAAARVRRMQQVAVLGGEQKDQPIDEAEKLAEELRQRQRADCSCSRSAALLGCDRKPLPRLSSAASTPSRSLSRAVTPSFWPASRQRSSAQSDGGVPASAEAAGMDQQPQRREIGEGIAFEDAAQIGLDIGGARQARIVAHEAQVDAVGAKAPERAFAGIEPVLQGGGGRAPAPVGGQVRAGAVEIVRGRHDHDRYAAAERFQRDGELPVADRASAHAAHVGKAEHVAQELLDEIHRGGRAMGSRSPSTR